MLTGQLSPALFRFGRLNVGLDVDVVIDDDLPFAALLCYHLQKTGSEVAFRMPKTGRRSALEFETTVSLLLTTKGRSVCSTWMPVGRENSYAG
jgi:hypothetical protein